MAKLVLMLRIKDGIFFLKDWLDRYETLVDEIVVLDNGSTDGTLEMLRSHPKVVDVVETVGYNEGRDKNLLYGRVRLRNPDWCLWLDVDEIFEPELTRAKLENMMSNRLIDRFGFRRFHFINSEYFAGSQYWLNYSSGHDRVMWREKSSGYFPDLLMDSPNVKGINGIKAYTSWRIKHLGYVNKALVDKKAAVYKGLLLGDPTAISAMYLQSEKAIKWQDEHNNINVRLLNGLLNLLLLKQFVIKGVNLTIKPALSIFKKIRSAQAAIS